MRNSPTVRGKIRVTGLLSLLELLSLLSLLRVAAGGGSPSGGSPSTWGTAAVGEWLFEEGFGVYREDFASHGIDGHSLLNLREHYLGEHFKIQRSAAAHCILRPAVVSDVHLPLQLSES